MAVTRQITYRFHDSSLKEPCLKYMQGRDFPCCRHYSAEGSCGNELFSESLGGKRRGRGKMVAGDQLKGCAGAARQDAGAGGEHCYSVTPMPFHGKAPADPPEQVSSPQPPPPRCPGWRPHTPAAGSPFSS